MQFLRLGWTLSKEQIIYVSSLLLAFCILIYTLLETLQDLNVLWQFNNQAYSHGYLLLGLVLYSLYERRDLFIYHPTFKVLPIALLVGLVWAATNSINIKLGEYLILPVIIFLFIVSYVGWKQSLRFVLPIAALFCALPIIGFLNMALQTLTVKAVSIMVAMADITSFIEGFYITLPHGTLHVDVSCSGLSYLSAGVTFAMIYSFLNIQRKRLATFSLLLIIALSLIANWIRVFLLVVVAYKSEMQSPLIEEHGLMGWIIFAFVFIFYLLIMRKIEARYDNNQTENTVSESQLHNNNPDNISFVRSTIPLMLAIAFASAPAYVSIVKQKTTSPSDINISFPEFFESTSIESYNNEDSVLFIGSDQSYKVSGNKDNIVFKAYAVIYETQNQGKELIYYKNRVGQKLSTQQKLISKDISVNYAIEQGPTNSLVFWFYRFGETEALTPLSVKAAQLKYMFKNIPAEVLILKIKCEFKCERILNSDKTLDMIEQLRGIKIASQKH